MRENTKKEDDFLTDWTIAREITENSVTDLLHAGAEHPVAIILIGANDCPKHGAIRELKRLLGDESCTSCSFSHTNEQLIAAVGVKHTSFTMVEIPASQSADHDLRHRVVTALRESGAKTVVLLWVKASDDSTDSPLYRTPPTPLGVDYLFTVEL